MYIKSAISNVIIGGIEDSDDVKTYLENIDRNFRSSSKSYASSIIKRLTSMRYNYKDGVRKHIMQMGAMNGELKSMDMGINDDLLVHFILSSLPSDFESFIINYNNQRDKCKKKFYQGESSNSQNKKKKPNTPSTQASNGAHKGKSQVPAGQNSAGKFLCKFCEAEGHAQRDCEGFWAWLAKKGTNVDIVSNVDELLYVEFSHKSWWIESGATVHVANSLQGFRSHNAKIKVVRSYRGGEFYGRHTPYGQSSGPFAQYLHIHGIIAQYSMPREPQQNGVAERRNRTLMDMTVVAPDENSGDTDSVENNNELNNDTQQTSEAQNEEIIEEPSQPSVIENEPLRRSQRERRSAIPNYYDVYLGENIGKVDDPTSFKEAITSEHSSKWLEVMDDELKSMSHNGVWDLVEIPKGSKTVGCKWVYKTKLDSKGKIERFKARLVAKGFSQREGIDYNETFSPVSKKDSFRIVMALVAHYDLELHQMDVKTAFLNGELHEDVYMAEPEGFVMEGKDHLACKLKKSIYELKQASRQWYLKFDEIIKRFGFKENEVDNCIYIKTKGGKFIILVLYVDDILLASSDINMLHQTKEFLSSNFDMKDLGEASYVLGIEIHRDRSKGVLGLSQKSYISRVLKRYNMSKCSATPAPIVKGDKFGLFQSPKNKLESDQMKMVPYASAVGSLMYAEVCTRPDLAFVTGMLSRFQSNPGLDHWKAVKKVLRYFQGTKDYMLTYKKSEELEVLGYSDADFAGCVDTKKSTSGYVFTLANGAISWKSSKQTLTTSSTMQAEFLACYEATGQAVWLKNLIPGLRVVDSISKPITLYYDNKAAVFYSSNNKSSGAAKHIDIKYHVVKDRIQDQTIKIEHISTKSMLADPLTKGLPPNLFKDHVAGMGITDCL
uniref:Gag-pol polyprotein n=1 Tax=Oryza sativa subsp. japonica TaxID=39947 RepID=Q7Y173_ORYSJ|nr:putative gag-pol polyprotein [Oryza sativa Japonica Group]